MKTKDIEQIIRKLDCWN